MCDTKTEIGGIFAIQQHDIIKHCCNVLVTNNLRYSSCPLEKRQKGATMKRLLRTLTVFATVMTLTLHPVLVQAQVAVGNANKIIAAVRGVLAANTRNLVVQDKVFSNEAVNTGADSAARFVFHDNTILSVGANSSVVLDSFVFDPDAGKSKVALSMSKGVMRFVSGKLRADDLKAYIVRLV